MVHYKLTYFNLRGKAEIARLILHHAEIPFEDFRLERIEWPQIKSQVDGKILAQSRAIFRYLAKQHGLAGKDDWEEALVDMYGDCIYDLHTGMREPLLETDDAKQKALFYQIYESVLKTHIEKIEERLIKNGTGFLVGNSMTWADIAYFSFLTTPLMAKCGDGILINAPNLDKLVKRVGEVPGIKSYVQSRPITSR